uniref:LRRCT domain-containing protein n=1 Tax=Macrostomum lignano TaxID=282301 RepID=A0A1I8FCJ3_9PLAT
LITAASFCHGQPHRMRLTACASARSVSCDFGSVHDRIKPGFDLSDFIPNADSLKRVGVDPSNFEDLYVNCKNSRALGHAEPVFPAQVDHHRSVRPNQNRARTHSRDSTFWKSSTPATTTWSCCRQRCSRQRTLSILKLSERTLGSALDPRVFFGVSPSSVWCCRVVNLTEFPLGALFPIRGLRELTLSENEIQLVPRDAARYPSCPTCKSPFSLMDIELTKSLSPKISLPRRLGSPALTFACPQTPLCWSVLSRRRGQPVFNSSENRLSYRNLAISEVTLPAPNGPRFVKTLRRRPGSLKDQLIVYASATDGHSASINVSLRWPNEPSRDNNKNDPGSAAS